MQDMRIFKQNSSVVEVNVRTQSSVRAVDYSYVRFHVRIMLISDICVRGIFSNFLVFFDVILGLQNMVVRSVCFVYTYIRFRIYRFPETKKRIYEFYAYLRNLRKIIKKYEILLIQFIYCMIRYQKFRLRRAKTVYREENN